MGLAPRRKFQLSPPCHCILSLPTLPRGMHIYVRWRVVCMLNARDDLFKFVPSHLIIFPLRRNLFIIAAGWFFDVRKPKTRLIYGNGGFERCHALTNRPPNSSD
jgi:hypothetical protein